MKPLRAVPDNQEGFVLVFVILILLLLVVVGISATTTTTTELQIAAADKVHKMTFYWADGGIYATPKLIAKAMDDTAAPTGADLGSATYVTSADSFYQQVMGYATYSDGVTDPAQRELALDMDNDGANETTVDVKRLGAVPIPGTGSGFGTGGQEIRFEENSFATGPNNAQTQITAGYRKVLY